MKGDFAGSVAGFSRCKEPLAGSRFIAMDDRAERAPCRQECLAVRREPVKILTGRRDPAWHLPKLFARAHFQNPHGVTWAGEDHLPAVGAECAHWQQHVFLARPFVDQAATLQVPKLHEPSATGGNEPSPARLHPNLSLAMFVFTHAMPFLARVHIRHM